MSNHTIYPHLWVRKELQFADHAFDKCVSNALSNNLWQGMLWGHWCRSS